MKRLKNQNAITLISLIVTVIILLILAATINLTLGNNGIFNTAQKAAKNYTEAQNKELANLNEFENTVDKVTQAPEYNPSLLKLKPGDYVKYDTGVKEVGNNGVATFRVLYDATSEYGLQIISDKNIANVTLGGNNWKEGKTSYNAVIVTLNEEAMKYKNDTYATDARCVGSNPINKNKEQMDTVILPSSAWTSYTRPEGWISDDTGCRNSSINYKIDEKVINDNQLRNEEEYWLASRIVGHHQADLNFDVPCITAVGSSSKTLCRVIPDGRNWGYLVTLGLRPCITIKPDITIASGNGLSEATAYTLGI